MKFAGSTAAGTTAPEISASAQGAPAGAATVDRTRDAVARSVLERGPQSAAALAARLGLSAAGVRRHLDALVADGILVERDPRPNVHRGRGRPARVYALTDAGRASFPHAYDDLASTALRYLRETGGDAAVTAFAEHRAQTLVAKLGVQRPSGEQSSLVARTEAMAEALSAHGYASTTETAAAGVQLCQHHCPVAHVAAEFPQLCEAETRAFENALGTYVQRLATIAHGDGVCTTHIPAAQLPATPQEQQERQEPRTSPAPPGRKQ